MRRGLVAGGFTWLAVTAGFSAAFMDAGVGRAVGAGALLGVMAAGMVASAWLLTALGLDLATGFRPGRRRVVWTFAVAGATLLAPLLLLQG